MTKVETAKDSDRLRLAIQRSGRLAGECTNLLKKAGITFEWRKDRLDCRCTNFPLDLMLVRDDDIPAYVAAGDCSLGIVGGNVLRESLPPSVRGVLPSGQQATTDEGKLPNEPNPDNIVPIDSATTNTAQLHSTQLHSTQLNPTQLNSTRWNTSKVKLLKRLGFGHCRLALAWPNDVPYDGIETFRNKRVATSYPETLRWFFDSRGIDVELIEISGSVEVAPAMGIADGIGDLVSTGATLLSNGLREVCEVLQSEALLVKTARDLSDKQQITLDRLLVRIDGVIKAQNAKYIMMNAPANAVDHIMTLLPGLEGPTVLPSLGTWIAADRTFGSLDNLLAVGSATQVAIHAVASEDIFWDTMEKLKAAGASSILVVPIEKIIP